MLGAVKKQPQRKMTDKTPLRPVLHMYLSREKLLTSFNFNDVVLNLPLQLLSLSDCVVQVGM